MTPNGSYLCLIDWSVHWPSSTHREMMCTCSIQNLSIDLVRQQTQKTVSPLHTFEKLCPRHRFIRVPQRHLTPVSMWTKKIKSNACDGSKHTHWFRHMETVVVGACEVWTLIWLQKCVTWIRAKTDDCLNIWLGQTERWGQAQWSTVCC